MVQEVLPHMGSIDNHWDVMLLELRRWSNAAEHQQFRGFKNTSRHNNLAVGEKIELLTGVEDDSHVLADFVGGVDNKTLRMSPRQNRHIWLVSNTEETTGSAALVNSVDAVSKARHSAIKDVFGDWVTGRFPCLCEKVSERLHLRDELRVSDWDRTTPTNLHVWRVCLMIIVISNTLPQIGYKWLPRPLLSPVLPHVISTVRSIPFYKPQCSIRDLSMRFPSSTSNDNLADSRTNPVIP